MAANYKAQKPNLVGVGIRAKQNRADKLLKKLESYQ